jgi:hypothetical protein
MISIFDHLPWLGKLARNIPGATRDFDRVCEFAEKKALERKANGSTTRDIFYHLVSDRALSLSID